MELIQAYKKYRDLTMRLFMKNKVNVGLKNTEDATFIPRKKYPSDVGHDCRANIEHSVVIAPGEFLKVPLGFWINVPYGHTADLRPRSGHASTGVLVAYGTIDPGYSGEVAATVYNFRKEPFVIERKDRIAQLVLMKQSLEDVELNSHEPVIPLERGEQGHGSTGIK